MSSNIRTFSKRGVTGVYQEGQYMSYDGDLQVLKSWMAWDEADVGPVAGYDVSTLIQSQRFVTNGLLYYTMVRQRASSYVRH
jgi:hypothetical protein